MSIADMVERKERPAYVRFERRAKEDKAASLREGRSVSKDVDFALVTPPYSKDVFEQPAEDWLAQMKREVANHRLPQEWYDRYVKAYEMWKRGEEMPLNGTPIKGWGVLSPAHQRNLIAMHVLTVEDLAAVNDEGLRRIGMGAGELRDKARAWIAQLKDKGPLTLENAALREENRNLKTEVETLAEKVKELAQTVDALRRGGLQQQHFDRPAPEAQDDDIVASDILPEETAPKRQPRRKGSEAPI